MKIGGKSAVCWKTRVSEGTPTLRRSENPIGADNQQERLNSCEL